MKSAEFETTWHPVETDEDKKEIKDLIHQTGKYAPVEKTSKEEFQDKSLTEKAVTMVQGVTGDGGDKKALSGVVNLIGDQVVKPVVETGKFLYNELPEEQQHLLSGAVKVATDAFTKVDEGEIPVIGKFHPMGSSMAEIDQTAMNIGGTIADRLNIDRRVGEMAGLYFNPLDPVGLIMDAPKLIQKVSQFDFTPAAMQGLLSQTAQVAYAYEGGVSSAKAQKTLSSGVTSVSEANTIIKQEQLKLEKFRKTTKGQELLLGAYEYFEKHGDLKGYNKIDEFLVRKKNAVNTVDQKGLSVQSQFIRDLEAAKRTIRTEIPRKSVIKIASDLGIKDEAIVDLFLASQSKGKKSLTNRVAAINKELKIRFANNPEFAAAYADKVKASLGHIRAASTFENSADILSNLELENFFINVRRSNKNELPSSLATALGASKNLKEEFLKFIDSDLGNFWKELNSVQKKRIRKYVVEDGMNVNEALEKVGFGSKTLKNKKPK